MILIPSMYCFVFMYLLSFIMVMGVEDWFLVWLGLEINMMSFLILIYRRYDLYVIESCMKYFFIQSLGSVVFVSSFYLNYYESGSIMSLVLSFKVGAGPFYYWFPSVCSSVDWISCYVLMFFQKVIPLMLMMVFYHWVLWMMVIISLIVGILGSFNQVNIKQLMAYSSIHHLGWIMIIGMSGMLSWFIYLFIYGFILASLVYVFFESEINNLVELSLHSSKIWFVLGILSMGGMPPLLGFFLKWMAFVYVMDVSLYMIMFLIVVSVSMLYVYMRIIYDVLMSGMMLYFLEDMNKYNQKIKFDLFSILGSLIGIMFGLVLTI